MATKILHLITGLEIGGAERMLEKLISGMDRRHFENHVVSLTTHGSIGPRLQEAGVEVRVLEMKNAGSLPAAILRLGRMLQQLSPDILQTWLYHADLVGALAHGWTRSSATLMWNLRCSDMNLEHYARTTRLVQRANVQLSQRPSVIIVNSEAGRRYHVGLGYRPPRWELIPNGINLETFRPNPTAAAALRSALHLPDDVKLIGMVARYDPMKDHRTFLAMAEAVEVRLPNAHFVLVGRGCSVDEGLFSAAKQRLGERLHLLGERKDVHNLLPAFDLCVLSSAYGEGFPNVLAEALACGVPCIATDVGDSAGIIGDSGLSVPPKNPEALADAAIQILTSQPERYMELRQRARKRAEQHFGLSDVIERYQNLYREAQSSCYTGARAA